MTRARADAPDTSAAVASTALLTDHYELTMLEAALRSGAAQRGVRLRGLRPPAARGPPLRRGRGHRPAPRGADRGSSSRTTSSSRSKRPAWSARRRCAGWPGYRFTGDVWGYGEGESFLPGSPDARRRGHLRRGGLLETLVLSVLNHDCAIAAAASRMTTRRPGPALPGDGVAAHPRGVSRRRGPGRLRRRASPARATSRRAAATASRRSAPPRTRSPCCTTTSGPRSPRRSRASAPGTTLLVDTYDVEAGVRTAVEVAGTGLGAVRLDSGDLLEQAYAVRAQLDELGADDDPDRRHERPRRVRDRRARGRAGRLLRRRHVAGHRLGRADRRAGLQARRPRGRRRRARRRRQAQRTTRPASAAASGRCGGATADGVAQAEVVGIGHEPVDDGDDRTLLVPAGRSAATVVGAEPLDAARDRHAASLAELPATARQLSRGEPAIPTLLAGGPGRGRRPRLTSA